MPLSWVFSYGVSAEGSKGCRLCTSRACIASLCYGSVVTNINLFHVPADLLSLQCTQFPWYASASRKDPYIGAQLMGIQQKNFPFLLVSPYLLKHSVAIPQKRDSLSHQLIFSNSPTVGVKIAKADWICHCHAAESSLMPVSHMAQMFILPE